MPFKLLFTNQAINDLEELENDKSAFKQFKAVRKALGYLETNPRHPALNTRKYSSIQGPNDEEVFEAYAENKTPAAWNFLIL